uniref:Uncharacterized protein n=1 Tax=Meloidogyne hapla TaxID=6305 RepID=A0A1I8C2C0_MELHA
MQNINSIQFNPLFEEPIAATKCANNTDLLIPIPLNLNTVIASAPNITSTSSSFSTNLFPFNFTELSQ